MLETRLSLALAGVYPTQSWLAMRWLASLVEDDVVVVGVRTARRRLGALDSRPIFHHSTNYHPS